MGDIAVVLGINVESLAPMAILLGRGQQKGGAVLWAFMACAQGRFTGLALHCLRR